MNYRKLSLGKFKGQDIYQNMLREYISNHKIISTVISREAFDNDWEFGDFLLPSKAYDPYIYQVISAASVLSIPVSNFMPLHFADENDGIPWRTEQEIKEEIISLIENCDESFNSLSLKFGIYPGRLKMLMDISIPYHERVSTIIAISRYFNIPTIRLIPFDEGLIPADIEDAEDDELDYVYYEDLINGDKRDDKEIDTNEEVEQEDVNVTEEITEEKEQTTSQIMPSINAVTTESYNIPTDRHMAVKELDVLMRLLNQSGLDVYREKVISIIGMILEETYLKRTEGKDDPENKMGVIQDSTT